MVLIREKLRIGLNDLLAVVKEFIEPNMSRSALDRMLRRHHVPSLKALAEAEKERGETPPGKGFKDDEPGFIHVDIKYLPKIIFKHMAAGQCQRFVAVLQQLRKDLIGQMPKLFGCGGLGVK